MVMREFGPPEVMRLEETSTPRPESGEVLIRVHAVSVNRTLDLAVRAGTYPASVALPHVPLDVQRLYLRGITVIGSVGRASADDVAHCLRAAADGRHRVLIDRVLPLAEAALAHRIVAQRSGTGKVVLQP